jgi:hypothetical protein
MTQTGLNWTPAQGASGAASRLASMAVELSREDERISSRAVPSRRPVDLSGGLKSNEAGLLPVLVRYEELITFLSLGSGTYGISNSQQPRWPT